jgi:tRNA nucleotidyltransferase/poly(A) polymerase
VRRRLRAAVAKLAKDTDLAELSRIVARRGGRVWIVGGALRDLALGRDAPEVDVAVDGDARVIAEEMQSRGHGRAVFLSGDRKPRVFRVAGRRRTLDVAEIEGGSIEADLARRDFTVNAAAVDLASRTLLDPWGGLADASRGRLRMVSRENLFDDPLRPLRAARLMATHGLVADRETSRACRAAADGLRRMADERVQAELGKLLEAHRVAPSLSWAASNGLLGPATRIDLPDTRWRAIGRSFATLDAPSIARLAPERRRRLRLAFLAGRAGLSPRDAASWLRRARWGSIEAGEVTRLLELAESARVVNDVGDVWRWLLASGDRASDALTLLAALHPRDRGIVRRLRNRVARRRSIPDVRGADVIEWAGVAPGPEVGRLLDSIRIEALAGRIRSREDARKWLSRKRQSLPGS